MNRLPVLLTLAIWSIVALPLRAQTGTATWALSSSSTITATTTGVVTAQDQILSGGTNPTLSVSGYLAQGQSLSAGNAGWNASPEALDRFVQFDAAPNPGNGWTVTQVSFEYGFAGTTGSVESNVYYSTDDWSTRTLLSTGSPLVYAGGSLAFFSTNLNVSVPAGSTFSLRIHPYAVVSQIPVIPQRAVHNSVQIQGTTTPVPGTCAKIPAGLMGWWSGDQNALDISGFGRHGSFAGSYLMPGKVSDAFATGLGATISVPDDDAFDLGPNQNMSIDFWMQTDTPAGNHQIISKLDPSTLFGYRVFLSNGDLLFQATTSGAGASVLAPYPQDADWHFVAVTWDRNSSSGLKIYMDGVLIQAGNPTNVAGTDFSNSAPLVLGGWNPNPDSNPLTGGLDEVEFFNVEMTADEVAAIYAAGPLGKCKPSSSTTGELQGYKFEDTDGDGIWDEGELGLPGIQIIVSLLDGTFITDTKTPESGYYSFDLEPGTYVISEGETTGYVQTAPDGGSYTVDVSAGSFQDGLLFGNEPVSVGVCLEDIPPDMAGWWRAEQNAADFTGSGNNGALQGTASFSTGYVGQAFRFVATSEFVQVPDRPNLDFGAGIDLSLDAWVLTENRSETVYIVDKRAKANAGSQGYSLQVQNGQLAFQLGDDLTGVQNFVSTGPPVANGVWHFVAVTLDRDAKNGLRMFIDSNPVEVFDPTGYQGSLENDADLLIGQTNGGIGAASTAFRGLIDEVEIFRRALTDEEIAAIRDAGQEGKCADGDGDLCEQEVSQLSVDTGFDHPGQTLYPIGGMDAFWTVMADPDTTRMVPRPANVIVQLPAWAAAQAGSLWIGPSPITLTNPPDQDAIGLGTYTYTLEFCLVGDPAQALVFNLSIMADNEATVRMIDAGGVPHVLGTTPANAFGTPTLITVTLPGPWVAGTYLLEVDIFNNAIPPDFTGFNLSGTITGTNLYMQKHECCNSDGTITGTKFNDVNGDGKPDGDVGMADVIIELWQNGVPVYSTVTDSQGLYVFNVPPGDYTIMEKAPQQATEGYTQTGPVGGSYNVSVGPGGMVANQDFFNQQTPCLSASGVWACNSSGRRYVQLTVVNNTPVSVYAIQVLSMTSGVTATVSSTTPVAPFPLAPGGSVVVNVLVSGLAPGVDFDLQITMSEAADASGISESCCTQSVSIVGYAIFCPYVVHGNVDRASVLSDWSLDGWLIRAREMNGSTHTTETDAEGSYTLSGLPTGSYLVSLDMRYGFMTTVPATGVYDVSLNERQATVELNFTVSDELSHTALDENQTGIPTEYALGSNYPNPFNPATRITYALPDAAAVRLDIFDLLGRPVATLVDENQPAGHYAATFDAFGLPSGTYVYRLQAGEFLATRTMVLMK